MNERIYVREDGLRVAASDKRLPPGCWWEDEGDYDPESDSEYPDLPPFEAEVERRRVADLERDNQMIRESLGIGQPSRMRLAAQRVVPLFQRLMRGTPCIAVWMGMVATFFWNSYRTLDEEVLASVIELPEEAPVRLVAAIGQSTIFLAWTLAFRSCITTAIRREFQDAK